MKVVIDTLGGRKSLGLILLLAIGTTYAALHGDIPENLMMLLLGSFGTFVGGNGLSHFADAFKTKKGETRGRPPKVELDGSKVEEAVSKALANERQGLAQQIQAISNRQAADSQTINQVAQILIALSHQPAPKQDV